MLIRLFVNYNLPVETKKQLTLEIKLHFILIMFRILF